MRSPSATAFGSFSQRPIAIVGPDRSDRSSQKHAKGRLEAEIRSRRVVSSGCEVVGALGGVMVSEEAADLFADAPDSAFRGLSEEGF